MRIPLQLIVPSHTLKTVDSYALVDSGADISCIDYDFVKKHRLPTVKLEEPIRSRNADGSLNKKGDILYSSQSSARLNLLDTTSTAPLSQSRSLPTTKTLPTSDNPKP